MNQLQKATIINANVKMLENEVSSLKASLANNQNPSLNDTIIGLLEKAQTDLNNMYHLGIENAQYPRRVKIKCDRFYTQHKDASNKSYWVELELMGNYKIITEF